MAQHTPARVGVRHLRTRVAATLLMTASVALTTMTGGSEASAEQPALHRASGPSTATVSRPALPSRSQAHRTASHPAAPVVRTIRVAITADLAHGQAAIDRCVGPAELTWPGLPPEIVQHNFCGGSWMAGVTGGELIRVVGGTVPGLYRANGRRISVAVDSSAAQYRGLGDLVLQTCVGHSISIVGLTRIG